MELDVSVPNARGAKPHATPTAEPVEEPAGVYSVLVVISRKVGLEALTVLPLGFFPTLYPAGM